jgi:hypothetical protein
MASLNLSTVHLYWSLIRRHIGEEPWAWLEWVIADNRNDSTGLHEWLLMEIALRDELTKLGIKKQANMLA